MIKLFLDDLRNPKDCLNYVKLNKELYEADDWIVVRNSSDFESYLIDLYDKEKRVPDLVSFDHDLGEGNGSGYSCALFLHGFYSYYELEAPQILVHSMNPVGAQNIKRIFGLL